MTPDVIFGSIGIVLLAVLIFEAYKYIKGHPQVLADIQKDLAFIKGVLHGSGLVVAGTPTPAEVAAASPPSPAKQPVNWSQYSTMQEAILLAQGKGYSTDEIVANWNATHPGGSPVAPTPGGSVNNDPNWTAFDGHASRQTLQTNVAQGYTVNVGKPFTFSMSECPGTNPGGTMTITASLNGTVVAAITKPFAMAVDLPVQATGAIAISAVYDRISPFDATIRPGA